MCERERERDREKERAVERHRGERAVERAVEIGEREEISGRWSSQDRQGDKARALPRVATGKTVHVVKCPCVH